MFYVDVHKLNDNELFALSKHLFGILKRANDCRELTSKEWDTLFVLEQFFLKPYILVNASELRKCLIKYYD